MRTWLLFILCLVPTASGAAARPAPRRVPMPALPSLILAPEPSDHDRLVGEACQQALGTTNGSVVAMDPRTGRVLALVNPAYGLTQAFQPCSVFKIVVGQAGLTEGVITPQTLITCSRGCWQWPGHGPIDLRRALAVSCNPYFERVGEMLGYERVQRYAQLLGLGGPSGINLPGESGGRLPASVRPEAVGHLSSHAAGITTSVVQLAVLLSATINGGVVFQPQVASPASFAPRERWRLPAGVVTRGMAEGFVSAVNEGSAISAFDPDIVVAGKTGTCSHLGWFASYAPAEHPEIVLVVLLRWGNGHEASAVAGRIYQALFKPAPAASAKAAGR